MRWLPRSDTKSIIEVCALCVIEYSAHERAFRPRVHATFVSLLKLHVLGEFLIFFVEDADFRFWKKWRRVVERTGTARRGKHIFRRLLFRHIHVCGAFLLYVSLVAVISVEFSSRFDVVKL